MTTKKQTPARAAEVEKPITPAILAFCAFIEKETGYKPDPRSVFLGSQLRRAFQQSPERQAARTAPTQTVEAKARAKAIPAETRKAAGVARTAARKPLKSSAPRHFPQAARKGSTIATSDGVVIAEQTHIDITKEA